MAEGGEGESVQVAVRMRLFNGRERNANATRVVRMTQEQVGSKTFIVNPDTGAEKSFAFDYSFQSHSETEQGIGEYATQDTVFNLLGKPVLYCALEGRNVCLFAYGQTGAGKSFSMLGKTDDPKQQGIIPRSCREIFRLRDEERDDALVSYKISIQVVEVYCEMINDLLEVRSKWPQTGHKPRLTKDGYVVDTVTRPCGCYDDIEQAFLIADKNRSVGSHALNPESSRAHTIYTINYQRQKKLTADAKQAETISAKINLVDLAGSERSESAGTTGQMLKEGNAINLSLTALGSTIKALSEGKRPNFRDSKLTLLLQGSMTNGKVIMIAAVSPASICFDESMSTLRFAERIKMVKIKAKKNVTQDPVAEIKKEMEEMRTKMQEEIDLLKAQSEGKSLPPNEAAAELAKMLADQEESEKQLKVDFEKRLASIEAGGDDEEAQKRERDAQDAEWANELGDMRRVSEVTEPHLRNLNSEARLAETLFYAFKKGTTRIGRRNKESPPDIEFNGMGIKHDHCVAEWDAEANTVSLTNSNGGSTTTVNGKRVVGTVQLVHNCRVWLGNNYAFRFVYPGQEAQGEAFEAPPDYFFAEAEICEQSAGIGGLPEKLGHQLSEALKKVEQANIIATDLKQPCSYLPRIIKNRVSGEDNVVVQVQLQHATYVWPWEKFLLRLSSMVVKWQEWQTASEQGEPPALPWAYPFDDNEPQLIGEADVWMQSLGNMIEHEADASLLAPIGEPEGRIHLAIKPLDRNGNEGPWEDEDDDLDPFVDNPEDLLDKEIGFVVRIKKLVFDVNLQFGHCKWEQVWVRYKLDLMDENEEWSKTEETTGSTFNPTFTYVKKHKKIADRDFIDSLGKKRIVFQVWGHMIDYEVCTLFVCARMILVLGEGEGVSSRSGGGIGVPLDDAKKQKKLTQKHPPPFFPLDRTWPQRRRVRGQLRPTLLVVTSLHKILPTRLTCFKQAHQSYRINGMAPPSIFLPPGIRLAPFFSVGQWSQVT